MEYIIGLILVVFLGREVYNRVKATKLEKAHINTKRELSKEKAKNVVLKQEVRRKAYYNNRNARGQFVGRNGTSEH